MAKSQRKGASPAISRLKEMREAMLKALHKRKNRTRPATVSIWKAAPIPERHEEELYPGVCLMDNRISGQVLAKGRFHSSSLFTYG